MNIYILIQIILLSILSMILGASMMFVVLKDLIDIEQLGSMKNILFELEEESE